MAFPLQEQALGYGDGELGNLEPPGEVVVNAYAKVTEITKTTITIADKSTCAYGSFAVGEEVLFHVIDVDADSYSKYLGNWRVCKITAVNGNVLTVTNRPNKAASANYFSHYTAQVVTIPHFKNVTLNSGASIKPVAYTSGKGGIVAFKCSGTLKLNGGHVDVANCGLTTDRRLTNLEKELNSEHKGDYNIHAGWENYATVRNFTLQGRDGSVFILANKLTGHADSRIGNPNTYGVAYARGDMNTQAAEIPSTFKIRGGSSILICAGTMSSMNMKTLAKFCTGNAGDAAGFGRCYIATESNLHADEGLYAYDCISDPERLQRVFNISDFGDGSDGVATNVTAQINNYCKVTAINDGRNIFTYTKKTSDGLAKFKVGALVMIHPMHNSQVKYSGRFHIAKIVGLTSTKITIDTPLPELSSFNPSHYDFQIVTIPQYSTFTLSKENSATLKYSSGRGGILAIAVNGTCDISGGKLNVEEKGGGSAYGKNGLKYISNAGMSTRLPLGQGHGSVFILANQLVMNSSTRIGATYDGNTYGGTIGDNLRGGYLGGDVISNRTLASGAGAGTQENNHNGGYGSNASDGTCQGAHVMIVADKITGFNQAAISTGGQSGMKNVPSWSVSKRVHAGASYGGGGLWSKKKSSTTNYDLGNKGGFIGGGCGTGDDDCWGAGGGSGAFAFVYVNEVVNQTTTDTFVY